MKTITTSLLIFLFFVKLTIADVDSPILRDQCKSDVRALIVELSPNLTEVLDESIDKAFKKIKAKYPNRFTTTTVEEEALENNQHIITRDDLSKRVKELKMKSSNPLYPKMLNWYQKIEAKSGLNPAQRLLAFRLVEDSLRKIKDYEKVQKKIKNKS